MKSNRSLMAVLVGLAMLAAPIAAAAHGNDNYAHNNSRAAHVSRSSNGPARNVAPAVVTRHEFHNNAVPANRGWRADRDWRDANAYRNYGQNYGNPGYYPAPVYTAPGYGAGYGGGQNCASAQRIMNTYYRDRNTGHRAAANDLLRQNQWAFRSGCAGGSPYAGGLLGGLGGYGGAPAYNNNYGGYNGGAPAYNNNYGGYNGGAPAYNNNYGGYNGGYGQPYGSSSMLAPLLQQFVR